MEVDECSIIYILSTIYNITPVDGSLEVLCGYSDKNYSFVDAADSKRYVLKIVIDEHESRENLTGGYNDLSYIRMTQTNY